jgi:hypothetical protein
MAASIPDEWFCPIGRELMTDPVIGPDGVTYERANIERWLATNATSPMTRDPMPAGSLIPNMALKHTIGSWLSVNPERVGQRIVAPPIPTVPGFTKHPLEIKASIYNRELHVALIPPQTAARQPICFIAILDNSGSMNESASMAEGTENFGFTRMDLTKHASHTILETLEPQDLFALVTFSTEARIVLQPTQVTADNKARIKAAINGVHPDSSTNIYDGIRKAAGIANHPDMAGKHIVAMMMTDGYPNMDPPRGILPTLATLQMANPWTLHTFGFGYNLDSALLENISKWGRGLFGFIPDCSMVGTVFINFLAHMLSTVVPNAEVVCRLDFEDGTQATETVQVGPVVSGQVRQVVLPTGDGGRALRGASVVYDGDTFAAERADQASEFITCYADYKRLLRALIDAGGAAATATTLIDAFLATHVAAAGRDPRVAAMLRDVRSDTEGEGQVGMAATTPAHYNRWGKHYMHAYLRSQDLQQCMNFKDPGLQIYGGDMFHTIQAAAETVFCTLSPPKPSGAPALGLGRGGGTAPLIASIASMSVFHNASSGCFHGDNAILMANGAYKLVKDVVVGDAVKTPTGSAQVRYTVECRSHARSQPMTIHGKLCITPWHPIRVDGAWVFPADVASYTSRLVSVVHNFVLDKDHVVIVGDVECCTLSHGLKGAVIEHAYFGEAVLKDLRIKAGGADSGHVCYENLKTVRHPVSGAIIGWIDAP